MPKPSTTAHAPYFQLYIDQVKEDDLLTGFQKQQAAIEDLLAAVSEKRSTHAYAPGKWTIKQLLQHVIDTERIFNYRALCFARGEKASLPGFDENVYADAATALNRSWKDLGEEFQALRKSTECLYKSFDGSAMNKGGLANNNPLSVSSIGFITLGHFTHHKKIIEERYMQP